MAVSLFSDLEPRHVAIIASMCVFLVVLLVCRTIEAQRTLRKRVSDGRTGLADSESLYGKQLLDKLEPLVGSKSASLSSPLRKELVKAGFFSPMAVPLFYASRVLMAIVLPTLILIVGGLSSGELPAELILFLMICFAGIGFILPPILLDVLIKRLREKYRQAFPDVMDLLVVCVSSGQSLPSAFDRVGNEFVGIFPELAANLRLFNLELRAGSALSDALTSLHGRLGLEEVKSLTVLLKQSEELGSSISDTLRVFSEEMRDKRMSRAETRANQLPVKMTIPLGAFIFPVILLLILTPVFIRISHALL